MKTRLSTLFLTILFLSACTSSGSTESIDKVLESKSNSLGNVDLVNDITKQSTQQQQTGEDQQPKDIPLGYSDQQMVVERVEKKTQGATARPKTSPTPKGGSTMDRETTTLQVQDNVIGTGVEATSGSKVAVHYTGTLTSGKEFDSSLNRGEPIVFTLGAGEVIKGWDIGIEGMKVGGKRHLVIPSDLAYGNNSPDPSSIPNGSTLIFDVELVDVKR